MIPSEIKDLLDSLGGGANKRLGQHFLIDHSALEAIVASAGIKPGDRVLEVGPGLGVLTRALLDQGADVTAIEQDRRFVQYLTGPSDSLSFFPFFKKRDADHLKVVYGDAADIHWHELMEENGAWKFVSNLPYSITSLALRKALWAPKPPEVVVVLVQREVAERAVAKGGKSSLLSLMVAFASESAEIVKRVPAGAFFPPPKVESAILKIVPMLWRERNARWGMDPEKIMAVAKRGFAHPRKLLASNLGIPGALLASVGLNPKARSEELSPEQWAALAVALGEAGD